MLVRTLDLRVQKFRLMMPLFRLEVTVDDQSIRRF